MVFASGSHAGDFVARRGAIASICRRPAPVARQLSGRGSSLVRGDKCEAIACLRVATPPAERFNTFESHPAATNAWRPHQVSGIAYLPNILHKCDRFDLSPRTNGKSKCSETRPMGAGRRQIESVALCVWQCHLRNVKTLSNRTTRRQMRGDRVSCPLRFDILSACTAYSSRRRPSPKKS